MKTKKTKTKEKGIYFDPVSKTYRLDVKVLVRGCPLHILELGIDSFEKAKERLRLRKEEAKGERKNTEQSKTSLKCLFEEFLDYRGNHVRESSLISSRTLYNVYLKEYGEKDAFLALSKKSLTNIYSSLINKVDVKSSWKNKLLGHLRLFVEFAYRRGYIPSSCKDEAMMVLENIPERDEVRQKPIWGKQEEQAFLDSIENPDHHLLFSLFIALGARLSEFLGITWDKVDLAKGRIEISQQLLYNSQKTFVLSPLLKTKQSYRVCPISATLTKRLKEYKDGLGQDASPFLFHSPSLPSLPLSKAAFRHLLDHYIALSKVTRITPHGFRHNMASKLVRECKNMMEVNASAKFLGHSPSMMMDVYSHSKEETIISLLKRIDGK